MGLKAIILAAGKGTRMKSEMVKVAHKVAGKPIVNYVLDSVLSLGVDEVILVIGHQAELVKQITKQPKVTYALQEEQLGTGHAVMQAQSVLDTKQKNIVFILAGDCPLIAPETLANLLDVHRESNAAGTILTTKMAVPASYGRVLRGKTGTVTGIVEAKDCTDQELKINEINSGIYCFESDHLFDALQHIGTNNKQKEYYLTDVIKILKDSGKNISAFCAPDSDEVIGINTRQDLAKVNAIIHKHKTAN